MQNLQIPFSSIAVREQDLQKLVVKLILLEGISIPLAQSPPTARLVGGLLGLLWRPYWPQINPRTQPRGLGFGLLGFSLAVWVWVSLGGLLGLVSHICAPTFVVFPGFFGA